MNGLATKVSERRPLDKSDSSNLEEKAIIVFVLLQYCSVLPYVVYPTSLATPSRLVRSGYLLYLYGINLPKMP